MVELSINNQITNKTVLVIDENGIQMGIMLRDDAIRKAQERDLDLVMVGKQSENPTCKFMNYGKYRYDQMKREKAAKSKQKTIETAEVQISLVIQEHDMITKANIVKRLISKGNNVRIVLRLNGREINMIEAAKEKLSDFIKMCSEFSKIKKEMIAEGRDLKVILEGN